MKYIAWKCDLENNHERIEWRRKCMSLYMKRECAFDGNEICITKMITWEVYIKWFVNVCRTKRCITWMAH